MRYVEAVKFEMMRPSTIGSGSFGTLIRRAEQMPGSWGGGTTLAIYAEPRDSIGSAGNARIWMGTATIERPADFSFFPGQMRVHVPIRGHGVRLRFQAPAEAVALTSFAQHRFDGGRPVHAELIDGPIVAFNLIAQPDVEATIQVLELDHELVGLGHAAEQTPAIELADLQLVYAVAGSLELVVADGLSVALHVGDALVFRPPAMLETIALRRLETPAQILSAALRFK
jgi:environmental stress-induced protein Ves